MAENASLTRKLRPPFEDVQAHYDLSDEFFGLFQDPSRTYSCAFFERQIAKIDMALEKLDLQPGMTLLDVGCGWGSAMKRAIEKYDVDVVGLTLSKNQYAYTTRLLDAVDTGRSRRVLLQGWEEFEEPVDRVVSIEAFEAFGKSRYSAFFKSVAQILPADGRMVLETIFTHPPSYWPQHGIAITISDLKFMRFIGKEIFPGGQLPAVPDIVEPSRDAGLSLGTTQLMNQHYVRTLDAWAANLHEHRDDAIATTSEEVYDRYRRYLTGCADFFRRGITEVAQFEFAKQ